MHNNDTRCAELISVIAAYLQHLALIDMQRCRYLSLMIDGATDQSVAEKETIYIRLLNQGKPKNHMMSIAAVNHGHSDGLLVCLETLFKDFGLPDWKQKVVGFCADGASVNLGQRNGVAAKLRNDIAQLIDVHCMAYRLELLVFQVQKKVVMVDRVSDILHQTWKTYHFSSKSKRELKAICEKLETRLENPAPVKGFRWISHLCQALGLFN